MIEVGRYAEAVYMLKEVLSQRKEEVKEEMVKALDSGTPDNALEHAVLHSIRSEGSCRQDMDDSVNYIYNHAVSIPLHIATITANASALVSSVIILNLALALHLSGNQTGNKAKRDSLFTKSLSLYGLVMEFNRRSSLLCMIVLNNVGLIHSMNDNHDIAQECFNGLLAIWMDSPTHIKCLEGVFFNAMGLSNGLMLPAPAA